MSAPDGSCAQPKKAFNFARACRLVGIASEPVMQVMVPIHPTASMVFPFELERVAATKSDGSESASFECVQYSLLQNAWGHRVGSLFEFPHCSQPNAPYKARSSGPKFRMRILLFINSLGGGGAERVTVNLARYWASAGHTVRIVTLNAISGDAYPLPETVSRVGLGLGHGGGTLIQRLAANVRTTVALRQEMKRFDCDVAVGMITMSNVQVACAALGLACGTVGSERVSPGHWPIPAPWRFLRWACYGLLDVVTTQTAGAAQWVRGHTCARRVHVIPNAVVQLVEGNRVVSPDTVCPADCRIILAVGRLADQKRFDKLIRAFAQVAMDRPKWELVILGEGHNRSTLESLANNVGLKRRVHLPGRVDNVSTWYRRASVFALTSDFEGFPNVLTEALAHGLPSVAVDCPDGPRDILRDNRGGLLVPIDEHDAMVQALERVMDDEALRAEMSRAAPAVKDAYREDKIMAEWSAVLDVAHRAAQRRGRRRGVPVLPN